MKEGDLEKIKRDECNKTNISIDLRHTTPKILECYGMQRCHDFD